MPAGVRTPRISRSDCRWKIPDPGGNTTDRLIFLTGSSSAFVSAFDQSDISFNGVFGYHAIDFGGGGFEIVAVPEPSSTALLGAMALIGLIGFRERMRFGRTRGAR